MVNDKVNIEPFLCVLKKGMILQMKQEKFKKNSRHYLNSTNHNHNSDANLSGSNR